MSLKTLYLLRHAHAANASGHGDEVRPLNAKGRLEAAKVGETLKIEHIKPEKWLVSSAQRTTETASRALRASGYDITPQSEKKLYLASAGEIIRLINELEDNPQSIIIVAHNPGIEQLVKLLCNSHGNARAHRALSHGYPPAALTTITFEIDSWKKLEPGKGTLQHVFLAVT